MLYRKLGNTGYDVSTIGFGTWQIGGGRWHIPSEKEIITLLKEANNVGINIFDVAVVYGQYENDQGFLQSRSQEFLGKAFAHSRQQVIYCVKLGQFDEYSHRHNYDPKRIVVQFQQSLRCLKTDYIDIALIHAPSIQAVKDKHAITVLQTLQSLGYIKNIGYSFEAEPEHVKEAIQQPIDVIMLQYNLLDTQCEKVIEEARLHGIGILAGGPFKRGYLTGKFRTLVDLPKEDDYWEWNINLNKGKVEKLLSQVNFLLEQYNTPENLRRESLHFILKQSGVASCIIGHRSLDEVFENIQLTEKDTLAPFLTVLKNKMLL